MSAAEVLDLLRARGIHLEPNGDKLRVGAVGGPDPEALDLIRQHKAALLLLLGKDASQNAAQPRPHADTIPRLPWPLERLLSAASTGVLRFDMRGVPDVSRYALVWGCAYLTGDPEQALRRLWELYGPWKGSVD